VADERQALLAYLDQQRLVLRVATFGLTEEQARATPTAGALSIGSLITHAAAMEHGWADTVEGRWIERDYQGGFLLGPDDSLTRALARYVEAAGRTDALVAGIEDLGRAVPVPRNVPWFPDDVEAWSVRWVLLHLIEETARHAGHADIIREQLDGATAFPLMAAVEGWPATAWVQPWHAPSV